MKYKIAIMLGMIFMLIAGNSFGQLVQDYPVSGKGQTLLPGEAIPKFADPLPEGVFDGTLGGITVLDATSEPGNEYNIHIKEFKAQVLPAIGVPAYDIQRVNPEYVSGDPSTEPEFFRLKNDAGLNPGNPTPTWVWGYLTDNDLDLLKDTDGNYIPRPSSLGPVVLAKRGLPAYPTYLNELPLFGEEDMNVQMNLPVDVTLDWANPWGNTGPDGCDPDGVGYYTNTTCGNVNYLNAWPTSVHIHGAEVAPAYDGGPDAWTTRTGLEGIGYPGDTATYNNGQEEGTIWFHPHEFGVTRLGVYAGLAGVYPILDTGGPSEPVASAVMPAFPTYDIPLIIQDRSFDTNGQLYYNLYSNPQPNPSVHPYWIPEFIGDTICVNGKTWPYLNVERRQYRFRLLNGSNARFYDLELHLVPAGADPQVDAPDTAVVRPFIVIATDDGYMNQAAAVDHIVIAPGERYEVIVDFRGLAAGTQILMSNTAGTPYPGGDLPVDGLTDRVMLFKVTGDTDASDSADITNGQQIRQANLKDIKMAHDEFSGNDSGSITRQLTLNEVSSDAGPLELVVNNSKFNLKSSDPADTTRANPVLPGCTSPLCRETELPAVGDTEVWEIINVSADAHPMHTHLVSFQLLERIPFNTTGSFTGADWIMNYENQLLANGVLPGGGPPNQYNVKNADGAIGGNPAINDYLDTANRRLPEDWEKGWKDTVVTYPDEVTRVVIRWAPQDEPVTGPDAPRAGINRYPFNPAELIGGVGYVWHCHILDHEDNEMMRNYTVGWARQPITDVVDFLPFDYDMNGCIDRADLTTLVMEIRKRSTDPIYDVNGDGVVNIADARKLVLFFTNPGGASCN